MSITIFFCGDEEQIAWYILLHMYIGYTVTLTVFWSCNDLLSAEWTLTYDSSSGHCYHVRGVGLGLKCEGGGANNVLVVECTV